jgi:dipeptidyl aminopeptidase/acylaminoacyl peptidase
MKFRTLATRASAFPAALLLLSATALPAQSGSRAAMPTGAAISPDGTLVAWTLGPRTGSTLHLTAVAHPDPSKERLISPNAATACASTSPIWSPDGATLAFLSTCAAPPDKPDQQQIFLWSRSTGETRQLTHLTGALEQPAWSPDGKSIAFLFVNNATRSAGAQDAMKPWSGVIGEDGVEIQHVYSVDVVSGNGRWLTPWSLHVYEFTWSPDSKQIAYIAAKPPGENNWWVAQLYLENTIDLEGMFDVPGAMEKEKLGLRSIVDTQELTGPLHGLQIAVPRFSPDGTRIAFIGGLMSDQGSTGGDIWSVPSTGGEPIDLTPNIDGTPCFEAWLSDHEIGFVEDRRGHTLLADWDATTHTEIATTDLGEVSVSGGTIKDAVSLTLTSKDPTGDYLAFVESSFSAPPEVFMVDGGNHPYQLTHLNAGVKPATKTISLDYDNEGFHVQGWLTFPVNYDPAKTYPIIVMVHGGPSASIGSRWGAAGSTADWPSLGYFTFQPNPRGSFGQGEKFVQANIRDFGYGDLRDILKGLDVIEAKYPIDKSREGITGWSYGGFMTMFAVTQTHRFRAAIAGAGVSDWQSYYGENSIDQWMIPFFGANVYDDPAVYAKSSAINFIKHATTPMLIVVGDRDGECPPPQSFEMWHALRDLGVKTRLVVYPNEGHGFRNPDHTRDLKQREAQWFAENMPAGPAQ